MDRMINDNRNRRYGSGMMFFFTLLLSALEYANCQVSLLGCASPVVYSSCDLTCTTPDNNAAAVKFFKPPNLISVIGQCLANGNCGAPNTYSMHQPSATETVITILNFTCTEAVKWRCDYNGSFHTFDLPCVDFPMTATTTDMSDNSVVNSSEVITVNLGCLLSEGTVQMKLDYKNSDGTIVDSSALSTCSNVSTCTNPLYSSYECQVNLQKESNVLCETKYSIEANVKILDADRTESIHLLNDVEFTCPSNDGSDSWSLEEILELIGYILLGIFIIVLIVLLICYCCLFNAILGSRYLRINSKKKFCWPKKETLFIHDTTIYRELKVGEEIEIQCLHGGKGHFVIKHPGVSETEKIKKTPFVLRNPCLKINDLKKKHAGEYRYESEPNNVIKGCLNLSVNEDMYCISITKPVSVYWADIGESLRLQLIDDSMTVCWYKTTINGNIVTKINSLPKKTSLVLKNISYEDEGSYYATNTRETWKSGSLELKIVNVLVKIGNVDVTHITTKGSSLKLGYTGHSVLEIKSLTWKSSPGNSSTTLLENALKNERILNNIGTEDEGHYWCEGTCSNLNAFKSGTLTVKVVDVLVNVGKGDVDSVCLKGQSVCLQYECEQQTIEKAVWKKSPRIDREKDMTTLELILKQLTKQDQGKYCCKVTYSAGMETKSEKSGAVKLKIVDSMFQVEMKSIQCSATIGESIEIRCTKEIDPGCIIFSVKVKSQQQIAPVSTKTGGSTLLIENISQEHDGNYHFESVDGRKKTGVLTLSVINGTERNNAVYIAKGKPLRSGNESFLRDSLTQIPNNQD